MLHICGIICENTFFFEILNLFSKFIIYFTADFVIAAFQPSGNCNKTAN